MPLTITDSSNISSLNSKIIIDLCVGNFIIDLSPSVFIGSGANEMLGAKVKITNPLGIVIKDYTTSYDIASPFTDAFTFPIPTVAGNYQYGEYQIEVKITDSNDVTYVFSKPVNPCYPDNTNKTRNYGTLGASLKSVCKDGKLYVSIDSLPTYNGLISGATSQTGTLEYPTSSNLPIRDITHSFFSDYLFEGVYKLKSEICASYIAEDNVTYKVKYKVNTKKEVFCQIDDCAVFTSLADLNSKLTADDCSDGDKEKYSNITLEALLQYQTAKLANDCGEDASEYIKSLQDILGCKCTCDIAAGAPVINSSPSTDINIEGCNIERSVDGLTTIFTINNYEYILSIPDNGGILTASAPTLTDCQKTIALTFSVDALYSQVKSLANQNDTEATAWAAIINKVLDGIDVTCLGSWGTGWDSATFVERITALKDAACVGVNISIPSIPAALVFNNGVESYGFSGSPRVGLGGALVRDTTLSGNFLISITQGRLSIINNSASTALNVNQSGTGFAISAAGISAFNFTLAFADDPTSPAKCASINALTLTGAGTTQTAQQASVGSLAQINLSSTGNNSLNDISTIGAHAAIVYKTASGNFSNGIVASYYAAANVSGVGNIEVLAGICIIPPRQYTGAAAYTGVIAKYASIYVRSISVKSDVLSQITNKYWLYQEGDHDIAFIAGKLTFGVTNTAAGTTGNQTINKPTGSINIAAGQTAIAISNDLVTASSIVYAVVATNDTTAMVKNVVCTSTLITITLNAAATAESKINFIVFN